MPCTVKDWPVYIRHELQKRDLTVTAFARQSRRLALSTLQRQMSTGYINLTNFAEILAELGLQCTINNRTLTFDMEEKNE